MNIAFKSLATTALLIASAHTFAASSVDLTVKGLITPSACTPALSGGGTVDYGKISAKDLKADQQTFLPTQIVQFSVTCDAATLMAMEAKDNREGSDANNDFMEFGLGLINGTQKLGGMSLRLLSSVADGVPVRTVGSYDNGVTWGSESYLMRGNLIAPAPTGIDLPTPVQQWAADLRVMPFIAKTSGLDLTNEAPIDGSVTLTVHYL
ncbi:MAG: DUF1120 domain-containing protein [Pseudomonas fluorescens]